MQNCCHCIANFHGCLSTTKYFSNFVENSGKVQPTVWPRAHVCLSSNPMCSFFPAGCWASEFSREMARSIWRRKALYVASDVFLSSQLLIFNEKASRDVFHQGFWPSTSFLFLCAFFQKVSVSLEKKKRKNRKKKIKT